MHDIEPYMNRASAVMLTFLIVASAVPVSGLVGTAAAANTTYDPSIVNGTQYIVTADTTHEITQNFTIDSVTTHDGEKRQTVTIVEKSYNTTNTTRLKNLYEIISFLRSQIEARENNLASGGLLGGSSNGAIIAGVAIVVGIALMKQKDESGGNRR